MRRPGRRARSGSVTCFAALVLGSRTTEAVSLLEQMILPGVMEAVQGLCGRGGQKAGLTDERLWPVAAWRETPYYSDAERAALAQVAALILWIATTNFSNRLNATVKEPAVATWG